MDSFGPARLLQSHAVLIVLALYIGFFAVYWILPKCCKWLPRDRGRAYTLSADAAKGKPTGTGLVFITIFVVISFLLVPLYKSQIMILVLTWLTMLT
ncbi:MAG: phospho-N-acetylmuramoyl-pentapeptide-transferase, partial [Candidatus Treponema excrementipullorum]|nr:phospho-N-acetylmuramoyl-pentapeptide-transferase [Candidatus Treponema excrementipullorum]